MQNLGVKTIGVSPAYFLSLHGALFTPENVAVELKKLKSRGFSAVQLEVFDSAILSLWIQGGMELVAEEARRQEMKVSAFVAHFLGECFSSAASGDEEERLDRFGKILDMMEILSPQVPLIVPLLPFQDDAGTLKLKARERLSLWGDQAAARGRRLALEIVPGSVAGSYSAFLSDQFWSDLASKTGLLLDTGHAHVMGEDLPGLIRAMGGRLAALHLSDNDGKDNRSDPPGDGSVDWRALLGALGAGGFTGSLDLEISGSADLVREKYRKGREYLMKIFEGAAREKGVPNEIAV